MTLWNKQIDRKDKISSNVFCTVTEGGTHEERRFNFKL